jgi:hypothetical protein
VGIGNILKRAQLRLRPSTQYFKERKPPPTFARQYVGIVHQPVAQAHPNSGDVLVLGLIGVNLGGLALARSRRSRSTD